MVSGTDTETAQSTAGKKTAAGKWLFVAELEHVIVSSRELLFAAVETALKKQGASIDPTTFRRYCLKAQPAHIAEALAANMKGASLNVEQLGQAIAESYEQALAKGGAPTNQTFLDLIAAAKNQSIQLAAITPLGEDLATEILAKAGLADHGIRIFSLPESDKWYPRMDAWMKICRTMNRAPQACVALTSSQDPCKSALSAGMRCLVFPDRYTAHHDFSGADAVLDPGEDSNLAELLELIL